MNKRFITVALIGFGLLVACDGAITLPSGIGTGDHVVPGVDPTVNPTTDPTIDPTMDPIIPGVDPSAPPPPPPGPPPICPDFGKTYIGFGGASLTVGRIEQVAGLDRSRVKPYSALVSTFTADGGTAAPGEFNRVMGNNPPLLTQSASTYDTPPARWFQEPQGTAVNIFTTYRVSLQSCTTALTATKYSTAPNDATARLECTDWMRKSWSRTPTTAEVNQCVTFAMTETLTEIKGSPPAPTNTTPARRWAYTCATVLTAAGFITY